MKGKNTKDMILRFLQYRMSQNVLILNSIHIEQDLPEYGKMFWDTVKLPSAYSRAWRKIRENKDYMTIGIRDVKEVKTKSNSRIKTWQIVK
jgi:hypothetical protein|tara:strand:- start:77 stop:349 length:273 start_codon:yes stop_codon:yes gene_type:complete